MVRPSSTRRAAFLSTRLGRRMFGAFLLCALVPTAMIAALSFLHVTGELERQEEMRLHHASRATGMQVIERLVSVASDLAPLAAESEPPRGPDAVPALLRARLRSLGWVRRDGSVAPLFGAPPTLAPVTTREAGDLSAGRSLLRTVPDAAGRSRVLLLVSSPADVSRPRLEAELRADYLFDITEENTLPPSGEFCVLDARRAPLACSAGAAGVAASPALSRTRGDAFSWRGPSGELLGYAWPLFLRASFGHESWTAVVLEPRQQVLAPLRTFDEILSKVTIASALLVALLSAWLIRRRLEPLEQLRDGTRRLAEGDFGSPVAVGSQDEIGELAASFNAMAGRLHSQLRSLATLVDTDRRILSTVDEDGIIRALVAGLSELCGCVEVAAVLLPAAGDEVQTPRRWRASERLREAELLADVPAESFDPLRVETGWQRIRMEDLSKVVRQSLGGPPEGDGVLLPLVAGNTLLGVALVQVSADEDAPDGTVVYARRLANQAAVALHAARMRASNRRLLYFDAVTGLPSRRRFLEELELMVGHPGSPGRTRAAVCLVGIREVQRVSDTLGQEAGDSLLRILARRVCAVVPAHRVARLAGPELGLMLDADAQVDDLAAFTSELMRRIQGPARLGEEEVFLSVAVGVARFPEDGADAETLLRHAGAALAQARLRRVREAVFSSGEMRRAASERLRDEADLRHAIERGELRLYFQPMVDVSTRQLLGAEALVRWQHPERGLISPDRFIGVAEEGDLIAALGEWVLREACRRQRAWREAGAPHFRVHVNLSPFQIRRGGFLAAFDRIVEEEGVDGTALGIEMTEGALIDADDATRRLLEGLRARGVAVAIDDFGTGYSALGYLKRFPVDSLKLDKSFVQGLPGRREDVAIAEAVLAMASGLGLEVVAEGVERQEQLVFLRELGCRAAQGYLFAPPLPADAFGKALERWSAGGDEPFSPG